MKLDSPSTGFASTAVFLSASLWGLYWVPLRYLESKGLDGLWAIAMLNFPSAVLLFLLVIWQWQQHRDHLHHAVLIGVFTGLGIGLYAAGLVYSSVVRATLLFYLTPVWGTLIGIFWLSEKAGWQRWVAIALGLLGLLLLVSGGGTVPLNIGDVFGFLSAVFWALGAAMIKRFETVTLASMTMFQFLFTSLTAILLSYFFGASQLPNFQLIQAYSPMIVSISILIILPSVAVVFWAQKFLFPGRVGLLMMSEVLVAVISASIFLPEERMALIEWAGAVLIISACLIEVMAPTEMPAADRN